MPRALQTIIFLFCGFSLYAETIEINDPNSSIQMIAMLGAASQCRNSDNLSLVERYQMEEITQHLLDNLFESGTSWNSILAHDAAEEMFGIRSNPSYALCANALLQN